MIKLLHRFEQYLSVSGVFSKLSRRFAFLEKGDLLGKKA